MAPAVTAREGRALRPPTLALMSSSALCHGPPLEGRWGLPASAVSLGSHGLLVVVACLGGSWSPSVRGTEQALWEGHWTRGHTAGSVIYTVQPLGAGTGSLMSVDSCIIHLQTSSSDT